MASPSREHRDYQGKGPSALNAPLSTEYQRGRPRIITRKCPFHRLYETKGDEGFFAEFILERSEG